MMKYEGPPQQTYENRKPLGEHIPALKHVAVETGANNAIRFDKGPDADSTLVDALVTTLLNENKIYRDNKSPDGFIYTGQDSVYADIQSVMETPAMQQTVESRATWREQREAAQEAESQAQNEAAMESFRKTAAEEAQVRSLEASTIEALKNDIAS